VQLKFKSTMIGSVCHGFGYNFQLTAGEGRPSPSGSQIKPCETPLGSRFPLAVELVGQDLED
jgi:hypothetical protein